MTYQAFFSSVAILAAVMFSPIPAAQASGGSHCQVAAGAQWKSPQEVKTTAESLGYTVQRIETDDNCYEVYALNKRGQRVEVYFHPVTLEVVKEELDD